MKTKLLLCATLLSLFFCLACGKKQIVPTPPQGKIPTRLSAGIPQQADQAWVARDYDKSQRLYTLLSKDTTVPGTMKGLIWKRLALSALANHNIKEGKEALNVWAQVTPEAKTTWEWNQARAGVIKEEQGLSGFENFLAAMLQDDALPWETRNQAAASLARVYMDQNDVVRALHVYRDIYAMASTSGEKKILENRLRKDLGSLSLENLTPAMTDTTLDPHTAFPKNILIIMYDLNRMTQDEHLWPQVWQDLQTLREKGAWAEGFPFGKELTELTEKFGRPRHHIALLIPLQGPYSSIGWRIARGVGAAQGLLNREGMDLEITLVNSAAPGWQDTLANLPATCKIVGGPLQKTVWKDALNSGLTKNQAFFTFMPSVSGEGEQAWRFFGSPRDQVRAMVTSARDCDISRFAILYPEEPYGTKMAQYFWEEATQQGGKVTGMTGYTPKKPTMWGKTVAKLLKVKNLKKGDLNPEPDFKAVFLPDSLNNAQLLVPQFFFYNENRLMFLGPQLWSQDGRRNNPLEAQYFDLAVFPGAWWQDNPGTGVADLKKILQNNGQKDPDFWVALGFDFVRFAARLGCMSTISSTAINTALTAPQTLDWTMAPLSWDVEGQASQHYFIFQPTRNGPRVADQDSIRTTINAREKRRQSQVDALQKNRKAAATETTN